MKQRGGNTEHYPLSIEMIVEKDDVNGAVTKKIQDGQTKDHTEDKASLVQAKKPRVRKYTVIDLVKSKRLFITSLIMWLAW